MRLLSAILFCIGLLGSLQQSHAQFNGCPPGFCTLNTAAVTYVGPGDVTSGALAWWGLRCYNAAYSGNVADVYAPADASHTLITCSAGGTLNETLQALSVTCAVSCTAKQLYDQTGGNNCGGGACDLTQATEANRPAFTLNCLNTTKPCLTFTTAKGLENTTGFGALAQAFSISLVWNRTANDSAFENILTTNGTQQGIDGNNAANGVIMYEGANNPPATANDNALHSGNFLFNNTTGWANIDGTKTTMNLMTAASQPSGKVSLGNNVNQVSAPMKWAEGGWWASSFTDPPTAMCHNQFLYWATATSC